MGGGAGNAEIAALTGIDLLMHLCLAFRCPSEVANPSEAQTAQQEKSANALKPSNCSACRFASVWIDFHSPDQ